MALKYHFVGKDGTSLPVISYVTTVGVSNVTIPPGVYSIDIFLVGGGGSGGNYSTTNANGGGGGGGVIYQTGYSVTPGVYSVTVGNGGAAIPNATAGAGNVGGNTIFSTLTAYGGGGGSSASGAVGGSGGSGGGAAMTPGTVLVAAGGYSQPGGYAYPGGSPAVTWSGGGGGGAGGPGTSAYITNYYTYAALGGAGGQGYLCPINNIKYGGGGGGGGNSAEHAGTGWAGGGRGFGTTEFYAYNNNPATINPATGGSNSLNALANTGGGGGAGTYWATNGGWNTGSGSGGSGLIIIRYTIPAIYYPIWYDANINTTISVSGITSTLGKTISGASFNSNTSSISTTSLSIGKSCSIAAWGKYTAASGDRMLFSFNSAIYTSGPDLFFTGTSIYWNTGDSTSNPFKNNGVNVNQPSANIWHHYLVINNYVNNLCTLYVDGAYYGDASYRNCSQTNSNFTIGNFYNSSNWTYGWNGVIDDFNIYDHILSLKEIKEITKFKVLHYKFDQDEEYTTNILPTPATFADVNWSGAATATKNLIAPDGSASAISLVGTSITDSHYLCNSTVCAINTQYTVSAWLKASAPITLPIRANDADITGFCSITTSWQRFYFTGTTSATSMRSFILGGWSTWTNTSIIVYLAFPQIEAKSYPTPFANGTNPAIITDCSGYGNDGLLDANCPKWIPTNKLGTGSINFVAQNQYILPRKAISQNPLTISFWYNGSDTGAWRTFFARGPIPAHLIIQPTTRLLGFYDANFFSSGYQLIDNITYHIVVVIDGTNWSLYINGAFIITVAGMFDITYYPLNIIGNSSVSGGHVINGWMDDLRIYIAALTQADVTELYKTCAILDNTGKLIVQGLKEMPYDNIVYTSGITQSPIGYFYKSGGIAGWNENLYSATSYTGNVYLRFTINDVASNYTMIGLSSNPTSTPSYAAIDYAWYQNNGGDYQIFELGVQVTSVGMQTFSIGDVLEIIYTGTLIKYYRNYNLVRATTTTAGRTFFLDASFYSIVSNPIISNIEFGPTPNLTSTGNYVCAELTEMDLTSNLLLWYDLVSATSSSIPDVIGNNTATCTGTPTFTTMGSNRAITFNGSNRAVNTLSLSWPITGTVSLWINASIVENNRNPICTTYAGSNVGLRIEEHTAGSLSFLIGNDSAVAGNYTLIPSGMAINTWYHIAITWNVFTSNVTSYVNGLQTSTSSSHVYWPSLISSFTIGSGFSVDADRQWIGSIADVRLYGRSLSIKETKALYSFTPNQVNMYMTNVGGLHSPLLTEG